MRTLKRATLIVLLLVAVVGLGRFSRQVRNVDAVGLFASGMLAGVTLMRLLKRNPK